MDYDYKFGNNYYKYLGKTGIKSTIYNILAPEQEQDVQPGMEYVMDPLPIFDNYEYKGSKNIPISYSYKIDLIEKGSFNQ